MNKIIEKIENTNKKRNLIYDKNFRKWLIDGEYSNLSVSNFVNLNPIDFNLIPFMQVHQSIGSVYHKLIEYAVKKIEFEKILNNEDFQMIQNLINYHEVAKKQNEVLNFNDFPILKNLVSNTEELEKLNKALETTFEIERFTEKFWRRFYKKVTTKFKTFELIGSEIKIIDKWKKVVGIIDLLMIKNNKLYIFDFKTSKEIGLNNLLQLNIYKKILYSNYRVNCDKLVCVKIDKKTGNMKNFDISDISSNIWAQLPKNCWVDETNEIKKPEKVENNFAW